MLRCELSSTHQYATLVLALRDMREINGRDAVTGDGVGNNKWAGMTLGMIVLDTLSGNQSQGDPLPRWLKLLKANGISEADAQVLYVVRNALLHGYGVPKKTDKRLANREVYFSPDSEAFAVDTRTKGRAVVSVPVFCGRLVERIAASVPKSWDISEIDVDRSVIERSSRPPVADSVHNVQVLGERPMNRAVVGKAGRVCAFARGDRAANQEAIAYARTVGVPEAQLDWQF